MKKKQYALLKYLSLQNKPVTCTKIANALSISNSSVKNYINDINSLYSKKIILSSRNGYELNQQFILPINHNNKQIPQTDEERSFYIIKELILHHSTYLDVFDLCENLYVSYSTIKSLLVKMNKTFSSYHIKFTCEKELVKVFGSEKNKRKLISFIINEESKNSFVDIQQLQVFFNEIDINKLKILLQIFLRIIIFI